jgi:hypothetical protein
MSDINPGFIHFATLPQALQFVSLPFLKLKEFHVR